MAYDTKTLAELERIAINLRAQIARKPNCSMGERMELQECQRWIELRRGGLATQVARVHGASPRTSPH